MSGHSKWATIKHKKGALDAKRGKIFSKLVREITAAAKQSGGNPEQNPRLRLALQKARDANMPADNIDRAIKKGTGELPGASYEEILYEGYGPAGVAVLVETLTDNKNRTTSEIRTVFDKKNGSLAGQNAVAWQFKKKGFMLVSRAQANEDKLMNLVIDAGAEDMRADAEGFEITTEVKDFDAVRKAIENSGIKLESAEITMLPQATVKVGGQDAKTVLALVESLEELEDVQNVYANFDIPDEEMEKIQS